MTGSEKILARILDDAKMQAEQIKEQAILEAKEMQAAAEASAEHFLKDQQNLADQQADAICSNAHSAAELKRRDALLSRRRAEIQRVLEDMVSALDALPDDAYFEALMGLLRKNMQPGQGALHLNARDLGRDTSSLLKALKTLPESNAVVLSDQPADIDGGFLLIYDKIEINASLSGLIHEKRAALEDTINRILFA